MLETQITEELVRRVLVNLLTHDVQFTASARVNGADHRLKFWQDETELGLEVRPIEIQVDPVDRKGLVRHRPPSDAHREWSHGGHQTPEINFQKSAIGETGASRNRYFTLAIGIVQKHLYDTPFGYNRARS